jgi:hypothetical protein
MTITTLSSAQIELINKLSEIKITEEMDRRFSIIISKFFKKNEVDANYPDSYAFAVAKGIYPYFEIGGSSNQADEEFSFLYKTSQEKVEKLVLFLENDFKEEFTYQDFDINELAMFIGDGYRDFPELKNILRYVYLFYFENDIKEGTSKIEKLVKLARKMEFDSFNLKAFSVEEYL